MPDNQQSSRREMWTAIVLLWLAGNALRLTILAVPPVIAMIRDEFALNATEVGLSAQHSSGVVRDRGAGGIAARSRVSASGRRWLAGWCWWQRARRCAG